MEKPVLPERALFESLARMIDEALIVYDQNFTILAFNARAEDLFKMRAREVIGQQISLEKAREPQWRSLSPVIYSSLAPTVVRLSDAGAYPQIIKVIIENPHQEFFVSTDQIADASGAAQGFIKVVRDVTREASFVQSKSDFIAIAAHQLRTPATAVNWVFEALEKDPSLGDEARQSAQMGHVAAQNLLKVITNLLNIAQIEEGRFGYDMQPLDLIPFLDALLADAAPVARQHDVNVYFERPPVPSVMVIADQYKLALAIANLVDNAIKYNVSGGQVVMRAIVKDGAAEVSVKDTGAGISEEDLLKIFEKFFRAETIKKTSVEGSGLGLYLTKNIIEAHKGKIWVESVIGRGSVFYFTVPLA